jgi:hypothetical protein
VVKSINTIVLIVAIATVALVGYQVFASMNRDAATIALLRQEVAGLKSQIAANGLKLDELARSEAAERLEAARFHEDVISHVKNIKITIPAQAAAMPQTEAIETTRKIIDDGGVSDNAGGATFTPPAFRKNLTKLLQGEEFSLALEASQGEVGKLQFSMKLSDQRIALYDDSISKYERIVVAKDDEIVVLKKSNKRGRARDGAVGVALGIILTLIIHK